MSPRAQRLVASRPSAAAYARALASLPEDAATLSGRIARLTLYPVKALGGVDVPRARVDARGLVEPASGLADRMCVIAVRKPGASAGVPFDAYALTNRIDGAGVLARGRLDGRAVVYEAEGVGAVRVTSDDLAPREEGAATLRVRLWDGGPVLDAVPEEGPLTDFARALLRHARATGHRRFEPEDVVAAFAPRAFERAIAPKHSAGHAAQTYYGDGAHFLLASSSTLEWMNDDLRARGERAIEMAAFRPNVVVDGWPPNAEDVLDVAEVDGARGAVPVHFASFCVRCDATRVDVATGEKRDKQPLAWLAHERPPRPDDPASATFGINAIAPASAHGREVGVGDRVRGVRAAA